MARTEDHKWIWVAGSLDTGGVIAVPSDGKNCGRLVTVQQCPNCGTVAVSRGPFQVMAESVTLYLAPTYSTFKRKVPECTANPRAAKATHGRSASAR